MSPAKLLAMITLGTLILGTEAFGKNTSHDMLIIGASVSNDYAAPSPGALIATHNDQSVLKIARNNSPSSVHDNYIRNQIKPFDYIVAVDLFFHDFKSSVMVRDRDLNHIDNYLDIFSKNAKVVMVGTNLNIRGLLGANKAKKRIIKVSKKYDNVFVLDVDKIYKKSLRKGFKYNVNGIKTKLFKNDLMVDMIHTNRKGNTVLANLFINLVKESNNSLKRDLTYLPL